MNRYFFLRLGSRFIQSEWAVLLLPVSWIWQAVSCFRHFLYDIGFFKVYTVSVPVISVGNLAVGGTGKTPVVIRLAKAFSSRSVAILMRGYGGDEAFIYKNHLPNIPVYADPDRVKSAKQAIAKGAKMLILDDGFQHRKLGRTVDLVIVRPRDLQGRYMPAGDLRDRPSRLKKMDITLRTTDIQLKVQRILTLQKEEISSLQGVEVAMFCGIGAPDKFKKTLAFLGAIVKAELILGDHEPIGLERLKAFNDRCKSLNVKYLVCTEKDAVKLESTNLPVLFVEVVAEIQGFEKLMAKIEERMYNALNK